MICGVNMLVNFKYKVNQKTWWVDWNPFQSKYEVRYSTVLSCTIAENQKYYCVESIPSDEWYNPEYVSEESLYKTKRDALIRLEELERNKHVSKL